MLRSTKGKFDTWITCMLLTAMGTNFALQGVATQSSTYRGIARKAIDGNTDRNVAQKSCSGTHTNIRPWWKVELNKMVLVKLVVLTIRDSSGK